MNITERMITLLRVKRKEERWSKLKKRVLSYPKEAVTDTFEFCRTADMLRTGRNCSDFYEGRYSPEQCEDIIEYLFKTNKMGAYCLCEGPPQRTMQKWILNNYPEITLDSYIMEVGPGDHPLFYEKEYPNWYGCDFNYKDGVILFSGNEWGKGKYHNITNGSWENLGDMQERFHLNRLFDIVCGSHSFEHNSRPVQALRETGKILKHNGLMVIFVPDGYSTWTGNYDKTHTMYLNPAMASDLFSAVPELKMEQCSMFRTNMDLVIAARKI